MSPTGSTSSSPVSLLQQHRPTLVTPLTSRPASPRHEDQPNPLETHELHCHQARGGMYAAQLKRARSQTPSTRSNSRIDCKYDRLLFTARANLQCLPFRDNSHQLHLLPAVPDISIVIPPAASLALPHVPSLPSRPNRLRVDTPSNDPRALPSS